MSVSKYMFIGRINNLLCQNFDLNFEILVSLKRLLLKFSEKN